MLAAALLALSSAAPACTLVFSQGRNPTEPGETAPWDRLNERLGETVAEQLEASGRAVVSVFASTEAIDPGGYGNALLRLAAERACSTLVEVTLFADLDTETLTSRLRAYPILVTVVGASTGRRIGAILYATQRDRAWSAEALERLAPEALDATARALARDYLAHVGAAPAP